MLSILLCVASTVVQVRTDQLQAYGVVTSPNVVLTAGHVVDGSRQLTVNNRRATVAKRHKTQDLAWLRVDTTGWGKQRAGTFATKERVTYAGLQIKGVYAICDHYGKWRCLLRLNKRAKPGDSGRPVYQGGKVVGVVVASKGSRCYVEVIRCR